MNKLKVIGALTTALVGFAIFSPPAYAHGFGERYDLPIPLNYFLLGAAATVAVSFVVIGWFMRQEGREFEYLRVNLWSNVAFRVLARILSRLAGFLSVLLLVLTVTAGLYGTGDALDNFTPTFVWIIWWVGVGFVVALIGNVWAIANPWQVVFEWYEKGFCKDGYLRRSPLSWPSSLDSWPALAGFLLFAWIENVYPDAITPLRISQMILIYSGITWVGMIIYGKNIWLRNGEAFSLVFGLFAKFAPIRIRSFGIHSIDMAKEPGRRNHAADNLNVSHGSEIIVRPFGAGLLNLGSASTTHMYFVLVLLASVTFDGFTATVQWMNIQTTFYDYIANETLINSFGLLLAVMIFIATYLSFCFLVQLMSGTKLTTLGIANRFIYTLIPIALAYHVAHFLVFLLVQGQLIIPLLSDPFGFGWDIWGSENYRLNFDILPPTFYWATSVIAIVVGHIIAVFVAHSIALRTERTLREAIQSQFPMLALMVGYTVASLWIITQPMYMPNM